MPACHAGGRGFESRPFRKSLDFGQGFFVLWQFLINAIKRTGRYWYNKYGVGRGLESSRKPSGQAVHSAKALASVRAFFLWHSLINAIKRKGRYWYNNYWEGRGFESSRKPSGQAVHSAKALTLIRAFFLWHSKQKPDPKENKVWSIGCF